ncbi:hypothetical protein GCM10010210_09710 [Pseudonocardia hydrocarbonoxydans]|uniref:ABC transporter domain-containing protein n=1 Tax=Pseudonocardia hydrocarbonoxydans TaxID=76726 RepID=A0A4Y3WTI3_9PSEU|nr:hypothetical protein PHY01_36930 [Pseudonocardia hydrocarbonoxydans]
MRRWPCSGPTAPGSPPCSARSPGSAGPAPAGRCCSTGTPPTSGRRERRSPRCCSAPSCAGARSRPTRPPACGCAASAAPPPPHRAAPWLDALGIGHLAGRDARTLSGGEAQRVALARALAVAPRILLLDEPFSGLDATTRTDLLADLRAVLDDLDTAVVLVTHDRHEALALADRTALLVDGGIRQLGPTAQVLDHPADADCARLVGYTNLFPPAVTGRAELLVARPEHCRPLRPDDPAPPDDVCARGTVRRIVPLGGGTRVDVDPGSGGSPLACLVPAGGAVGLRRGQLLTVTVGSADLRAVAPAACASDR